MPLESERDALKGCPVFLSDHREGNRLVCLLRCVIEVQSCNGVTGIFEGSVDWGYEGYEIARLPLRSCAEGAESIGLVCNLLGKIQDKIPNCKGYKRIILDRNSNIVVFCAHPVIFDIWRNERNRCVGKNKIGDRAKHSSWAL